MPHLGALHGTALKMTRSAADADDLVQDTLLRAYRFWDKYEKGTNAKAWLFKILTRTFINRYHQARRDQDLQAALAEDEKTGDIVAHEAGVAQRDPEGALIARLLTEDVLAALAELPDEYRLAVLLCDVEEFSYKEIADILECPIGTVMSRLHRGRRLLQRRLHEQAVERGIVQPAPRREAVAAESQQLKQAGSPISLERYRRERKGE